VLLNIAEDQAVAFKFVQANLTRPDVTRSLDEKSLPAARRAVDLILNGLEPNSSFAVDRHWTLMARNALPTAETANSGISIPLRLMKKEGELSFIGTVTVFGTPIDVTLSELAIESFFPVDQQTANILRSRLSQDFSD